jgi:arylesterase / paraoxonase
MASAWFRIAITAGAVLSVTILAGTYRLLESHGVFTTVRPAFSGTCRTIAVGGPGDIAVDAKDKIAFISASGRALSSKDGLYSYAYDRPDAAPVRLAGTPKRFHPGGISLYRATDGSLTLMAINHPDAAESFVDIFTVKVANGVATLSEIGSIAGDVLTDPSALAATGDDSFYIVNRHASRSNLGRWLDDVLVLPRAEILYFDGMKFRAVTGRLNSPGGAALSADGRYLYVTEYYPRMLVTLERNQFSGQLEPVGSLAIPSGLEEVDVAADGSLWIGAEPKAFAADAFRRDASKPAPSQVFRVTVTNGVPQSASVVYANRGEQIGAASVGAAADGHLLIGSSLDDKMLDCRLPSP